MKIKRTKYFFCLLNVLIAQSSLCQIHGVARQAHAAESSKRIKTISVYRSLEGQKKAGKVNLDLDKKKMYLSSIENYNKDDQLQSDKMINRNGIVIARSVYEYDKSNRLTGTKRYWEDDSIYMKRQYLENQIIIHKIKDNKVKSPSIQYLNHNDKVTDWIFLNLKRDTLYRYEYQYDDKGNEIHFVKSGPKQEDNYRIRKYYNHEGEIKRSEEYDYRNKLIEEIDYVEIKNVQLKNSNHSLIHQKVIHKIHEEGIEKFETEAKYVKDKFNNIVKIYSNQNCAIKGKWNITYLDIEYEE